MQIGRWSYPTMVVNGYLMKALSVNLTREHSLLTLLTKEIGVCQSS